MLAPRITISALHRVVLPTGVHTSKGPEVPLVPSAQAMLFQVWYAECSGESLRHINTSLAAYGGLSRLFHVGANRTNSIVFGGRRLEARGLDVYK